MKRHITSLLACLLSLGACAGTEASADPDVSADSAGGGVIMASAVTLDRDLSEIVAGNVQEALEAIAAGVHSLSSVTTDVAGLTARVTDLEKSAASAVMAESVGLDDSVLQSGATELQSYAEVLWARVEDAHAAIAEGATAREAHRDRIEALEVAVPKAPMASDTALSDENKALLLAHGQADDVDAAVGILFNALISIEAYVEGLSKQAKCPDGMDYLDNALCVDYVSEISSWSKSGKYCRAKGRRLCTASEFYSYCSNINYFEPGAAGPDGGIVTPEWIDGVVGGGPGAQVVAMYGAACDLMEVVPLADPALRAVRCCKDIPPTLPAYTAP